MEAKLSSDTFHTGVKSYDKSSVYLPHLRIATCIVETYYVAIRDDISKMSEK